MRNLADAVHRAATRDAAAPALRGEAAMTWGQVDRQVDAVAGALHQLDLPESRGARARVALALPNVPEFVVALFGVLRAGFVAVPVNPGYTARELRHVLADSDASVIVATSPVLAAVDEVRADLPALTHSYVVGGVHAGASPFTELLSAAAPAAAPTAAPSAAGGTAGERSVSGGEDLAVLLYTSGTGGTPKGVMLSHRALVANHQQRDQVSPPVLRPDDVVLLALPLFHAFGLNASLGAVAWHGACGVLVERFDPAHTLDLIARHSVTVVAAVPQMYVAWSTMPDLAERMSSVRLAVSGAAPLDPEAARRMQAAAGLQVVEGYGLSETSPVVAMALASPVPKAGSVGRPLPGVEVKLVGSDGVAIAHIGPTGLEAGGGDDFDDVAGGAPGTDPGEIVVRGPNLFSGYWPDGAGGPDPDGWWATGDVAYADADGDLFLVDRLDELILVSGFNVYPYEVEMVLAGHPGVAEAAAVGVDHPYTGQAVKAYVVAAEGASVSAQDLMTHCERNLARFKCPTEIVFLPELPHSATGKVRKGLLGRGAAAAS